MTAPLPALRPDIAGHTVLVRADFDDGVSEELARAVRRLARAGARVAVVAGRGAPNGEFHPACSLEGFAEPLAAASGVPVAFVSDCVGCVAEAGLGAVPFGEAALMENLRFHADAKRDSRSFAIRLSALGDFFLVTGPVPNRPIGWLSALTSLLPSPETEPQTAET